MSRYKVRIVRGGRLERQVLRLLCFVLAVYSILTSIQFVIGYKVFHYASWLDKTINDPRVIMLIMIIPFFTGAWLLYGKIRRKRRVILYSLFATAMYHLSMSITNAIEYALQGTPMLPYLFVGLVSLILLTYYRDPDPESVQPLD